MHSLIGLIYGTHLREQLERGREYFAWPTPRCTAIDNDGLCLGREKCIERLLALNDRYVAGAARDGSGAARASGAEPPSPAADAYVWALRKREHRAQMQAKGCCGRLVRMREERENSSTRMGNGPA